MHKYRIYCETDSKFEYVIASVEPTKCPVNDVHTIKADCACIVQQDIMINDGTLKKLTLADYKQLRYNEIDGKTLALIDGGFTHDGQVFSLSVFAQMNWHTLKNQTGEFTFPKNVSRKNNTKHSLSQANVDTLWDDGKVFIENILDVGRNLKQDVFDADDETEVDAVVDGR